MRAAMLLDVLFVLGFALVGLSLWFASAALRSLDARLRPVEKRIAEALADECP